MQAFGDVSGHFKGLLNNDCQVCVAGVVFGDTVTAGRCPKKSVDQVTDIDEAKWNDLLDKQKRRLFECLQDQDHLEFAYALFTKEPLEKFQKSHLLYQDVSLPPAWDLALTGYAYGEALFENGARESNRVIFEFDQVISKPQGRAVKEHVQHFVPDCNAFVKGSRKSSGIQAADCLAGAVAEDYKRDTDWLDHLDDDKVSRVGAAALAKLENDLYEYDTGP
jgi:hypothetical protein